MSAFLEHPKLRALQSEVATEFVGVANLPDVPLVIPVCCPMDVRVCYPFVSTQLRSRGGVVWTAFTLISTPLLISMIFLKYNKLICVPFWRMNLCTSILGS